MGWGILGICALLTWQQVPRFATDQALWAAAHRVSPASPRPMVNLAADAIRRGDFVDAEAWIRLAQSALYPTERRSQRRVVLDILDRQRAWIAAFSWSPS